MLVLMATLAQAATQLLAAMQAYLAQLVRQVVLVVAVDYHLKVIRTLIAAVVVPVRPINVF
jgi:hypothetical protein